MKFSFRVLCIAILFIASLLATGCRSASIGGTQAPQPNVTPASPAHAWAIRIEKPGLPNLHRVSDDLYRGAQPTAEGFRQLKAMGVRTIINLRLFYNDQDKFVGTDLGYEEIPMNAWYAEDEDVICFLKLVTDRSRAPFFIHCQYGADRTGMLCAVYRIVIQGWTKDEAISEMTQGEFGFHGIWQNLVEYVRKLDVKKLKRQALK